MSRKIRLLVLLALMLLPLAGAQVATAQSSDSEPVSTLLTEAGAVCGINIYTLEPTNTFGQWEFQGGAYVETTGQSTVQVFGDLVNVPATGCDIGISFNGLSGPGGTIELNNFTAESVVLGPVDPADWGTTGYTASNFDFTYTLESVPSTLSSGTYSGTIDAVISNTV